MDRRALASAAKAFSLFALVFVLLLALAYAFGAAFGVLSAAWVFAWAGAALIVNVAAFVFGPRLVIAAYGIQMLKPGEAPRLEAVVQELAAAAGIPAPHIGLISDSGLNALGFGRSPRDAYLAATTGLLGALDDEELRGVVAHELSHVLHRDSLVMTAVATVSAFFAYAVPIAVLSMAGVRRVRLLRAALVALAAYVGGRLAAALIRSLISRSREFQADAGAVRLVGSGRGLSGALRKIDAAQGGSTVSGAREASAHLFFASPLEDDRWRALFDSHPPIPRRLERLAALSP